MNTLKTILLALAVAVGYMPKCEAVEPQVSDNNSLLRLIEAIAEVESGENPMAFNSGEDAVGYLQIRPIMVKEVNRICELLKLNLKYVDEDRWNKKDSIAMAAIFLGFCREHWHLTPEQLVRGWNGGMYGWQKVCTKKYAKKVMKIYEANNAR